MEGSYESKVFGVSRDVRNWSIGSSEYGDLIEEVPTELDYSTETYWSVYTTPPLLSSQNGSIVEGNDSTTAPTSGRDEDLAKIEMAVLALIFILTVLGNFVVLLGIFFRRQKMTRMYYFILHLSVADLITAFFNVLTQLFWEITYRFQGGNLLCKFVKYTQILGPYSSSYVLVMTALDRYQAICYPLSNCTWTAKRSKIMLAIAWSISLLCCVPQIFFFSYQMVNGEYWECWATFPAPWVATAYVTWYSITVFIIPLVILVFAYGCITRTIWINFNMKAASRNHDNYEKKMTRQDSEEGDGPSQYEHSQDESVFQRESRFSLRANASHSVSTGGGTAKNTNLFSSSKYFLTTKTSTTSTSSGGGMDSGNESNCKSKCSNRDSKRKARTSTSSSATQSTTLSPSLSGRRIPALDDNEKSKSSSLCYTSQKLFVSNGVKEEDTNNAHHQRQHQGHHIEGDEEQLHLIPKESERNDLCNISGTRACHNESASNVAMKNGSVKFSGASRPDTCQHGCYEHRCNFCHSHKDNGVVSSNTENLIIERGSSRYHVGQHTPSSVIISANPEKVGQSQSQTKGFLKSASRFSRKNKFSRRGRGGSMHEGSKHSTKSSVATYVEQPRTHSVKGISRAKIKTIKLTVTIICCYIFCSSPFIAAQLWSVYDPDAANSAFFKGPTFTILTLLASLNSCVNPYIFLFFNPNLLENCFRGIFRPKFPARRFNNGSPLSRTLSQNKKAHYGVGGNGNSTGSSGSVGLRKTVTREGSLQSQTVAGSTAPSHLSPLISQDTVKELGNGFGNKGSQSHHLKKLAERSENVPNAVELVDSNPSLALPQPIPGVPLSSEKYSPIQSSCRVETTTLNNHMGGTSTLIT